MLSGALVDYLSETLNLPADSVRGRFRPLHADLLLSKEGRGPLGARMTNRDAIVATLANVLEIPRGTKTASKVGATVREAFNVPESNKRALPDNDLMLGLKCAKAPSAGACLEWLLDDLRSGRMAKWANGEDFSVGAVLEISGNRLAVSISLPNGGKWCVRHIGLYFERPKIKVMPAVRKIELRHGFFAELAKALGPPT